MSERKIRICGGVWRYRVGHAFVRFVPPTGKAFVVSIADVTGRSWEVIERGRRKRTCDASVLPSDIASFIRKRENALERVLSVLAR